MKNKVLKILVAIMMVFTILPTLTNVKAATTLNNPTITDGVTTWDCIWFGNYYQSNSETKDPIRWRVLSINGNDAFIVSDQNLDFKKYNEDNISVTWKYSTIRSWLNGYDQNYNTDDIDYSSDNFLDTAFTAKEQAAIKTTTVDNYYEYDSAVGGFDTKDKVYLLSVNEVSNALYGFDTTFASANGTRIATNTAYIHDTYGDVANEKDEADMWWLRSPGNDNWNAACIGNNGDGYVNGTEVQDEFCMIRPCMHIDLSKADYEYAGTVSSNGTNNLIKCSQSINAKTSYTKVYGNASFNLNATAKTSLSYYAYNPSVVNVDSTGKVTINGVGTTTIQITAEETDFYAGTSIVVRFVVNPKATTLSSLTKASKAFTVKWAKVSTQCTGYQIQYSTSSKFTSAKTVTVTSYKTTSKKISSLKSKKKYYVRVRTYKTVNSTKYYSSWSGYKTVTTK